MSHASALLELLSGPVLTAAPALLGATLTANGVTIRLTEVEAYDGANDPGSHAYRGPTARNEVMFGPPGHLYCYFIYGMHHCMNVVCAPEGTASAVLLRAGEVVDGIARARERRRGAGDRDLARGPARLCQALDLDRGSNGISVLGPEVRLRLPPARRGRSRRVLASACAPRQIAGGGSGWRGNSASVPTVRPQSAGHKRASDLRERRRFASRSRDA
ncbi:MAG: DNA-3-methyladenine glycosylase [Nocardioides sp.]